MSTFTANRFALLAEEGETSEPASVSTKKSAVPQSSHVAKKPDNSQRGANPNFRGQRRQYGGGDGGEPPLGGEPTHRDERGERRGRGGFRGGDRGGDRGGFRGRGRGKGERLDRQSATGTHDTEKKIASGWGADEGNSELRAAAEADDDVKAEASTPNTPAIANGTDTAAVADVVQEEEDKTKTLGEYLAERSNVAPVTAQFRVREANEGTDESQWKDGVELVRSALDEQNFFVGKAKKTSSAKKQVKEKVTLDVEPQVYRPPRDNRGGRGGRGGRGRGGDGFGRGSEKGAGRGGGGDDSTGFARGTSNHHQGWVSEGFDAGDQSAFPSLT